MGLKYLAGFLCGGGGDLVWKHVPDDDFRGAVFGLFFDAAKAAEDYAGQLSLQPVVVIVGSTDLDPYFVCRSNGEWDKWLHSPCWPWSTPREA